MIGGKILHNESFIDASIRIVKSKCGLDEKFLSINSIMHERVEGDGIIKHSFILFFTKVAVQSRMIKRSANIGLAHEESIHGELGWFDIQKLEKNIIPSDLWLIKNKISSKVDIKSVFMKEDEGQLKEFRFA